jgi:hypothetical protein
MSQKKIKNKFERGLKCGDLLGKTSEKFLRAEQLAKSILKF